MPALVVANAALLRLIWTNGATPYAVNVIGVENPTNVPITQAMADTLNLAIKGRMVSSGLGAVMSTAIFLDTIGIRSIHTANQPEFLASASPNSGVDASGVLPLQVALCVTLRTALAGRSYRGRCFLCGFAEGQSTGGNAVAGVSTAAVAFLNGINTELQAVALNLGVVSRPNPAALPPKAGWVTEVTGVQVRSLVWQTIRKRSYPGI